MKRTERLNLYKAMTQSTLDAGTDDVPVVLHRKSKEQWVAIVPLTQLKTLAERIVKHGSVNKEDIPDT